MNPITRNLSRRTWLGLSAGLLGSGWLAELAAGAAQDTTRRRSCILLWMAGGPAQTDTFDLKPRHENGGPFREIATATPGVRIGERLPRIAQHTDRLSIIRSMRTQEGDHGRATLHMRTGYQPQPSIHFPAFGSLVSKERDNGHELPGYISIRALSALGATTTSPGFLGPRYAPLVVGQGDGGEGGLRVQNLDRDRSVSPGQAQSRLQLLQEMEADFLNSRPGVATRSHRSAYEQAAQLMHPRAAAAFELAHEPDRLRDGYGRNRFGQGCLLARRLIERGVPFVEVTLGGWDTHQNNFESVRDLCDVLDPAWSTLMADLRQRGMLDDTLVIWMGEFGRTPVINSRLGRDHFPHAWSVVLGGGGIRGGTVIGATEPNGLTVADRPVNVPDLMSTICTALGIDPMKQNLSNVGRPIRIADPAGRPVREALA